MSPCGGECRVGRTLLRGGPSSPARGADPRRRQHRPIATNKPSTSAAARRPPIATPSAAQAAGAGRAPRRSISHAHRCPRRCAAASRSSNISIIFPRKEFREKESATAASRRRQRVGRIAGRSADRRRWVGAPLVRARDSARVWSICPTKLLSFQCRVFGDDPVAEPRGAAGSRSRNISIIDVAVWRRVSCWSHAAARWPVVAGARR